MNIELADSERDLLLELLESRWSELKEEIHHARVSEFKDALRVRAECMKELIEKLEAVSV
jgi:hypothetical protein